MKMNFFFGLNTLGQPECMICFKVLKNIRKSIFGTTYGCESAFSEMVFIKSKYRHLLTDTNLENLLRIKTSNIDIDFDNLIAFIQP